MEPADNAIDCDEVLLLKKKLAETEDKLVKFKKFVVNLRNERTQLQDQVRLPLILLLFILNNNRLFASRFPRKIQRLKSTSLILPSSKEKDISIFFKTSKYVIVVFSTHLNVLATFTFKEPSSRIRQGTR